MYDDLCMGGGRGADRRRRPTSPLDCLRLDGRRRLPRRGADRSGAYFVDRFDAGILALVVGLLGLTIADGVLTIELLDLNSEELNPIMAHLLGRGVFAFLMGKYLLTATGLPFLVVFQHYRLFGSRFRVGWLLPMFVGLYLVLLFYQWNLLHLGRPAIIASCAGRIRPSG
jgi:Domain of unknown function (DUF5658)